MRDKTRVLVTHATQFLPKCDRVILLSKGAVVDQGTYEEVYERNPPFHGILKVFTTTLFYYSGGCLNGPLFFEFKTPHCTTFCQGGRQKILAYSHTLCYFKEKTEDVVIRSTKYGYVLQTLVRNLNQKRVCLELQNFEFLRE